VADRHFDEIGLSEDSSVDRDPCELLLQRVELSIEMGGHFDRVRPRLLLNAHNDGGLSAARPFPPLQRPGLAYVCDVAHKYRSRATKTDDAIADLVDV